MKKSRLRAAAAERAKETPATEAETDDDSCWHIEVSWRHLRDDNKDGEEEDRGQATVGQKGRGHGQGKEEVRQQQSRVIKGSRGQRRTVGEIRPSHVGGGAGRGQMRRTGDVRDGHRVAVRDQSQTKPGVRKHKGFAA